MGNWGLLFPLLFLITAQDALTGISGAPGIVATIVASNAITPRRALLLSTLAQLLGPFMFGVAVATTLGSVVVDPHSITPVVLYAALSSTVIWMLLAWYFRIPSSSTHAVVGGLIGAVFAALGPSALDETGLLTIMAVLTLTAPLGILGGFVMTRLFRRLTRNPGPRSDRQYNRGQLIIAMVLGMAIGSNNAQNVMGVAVLGLISTGFLPKFEVPLWVIVATAACLAAGNLVGGMRLIRSVGEDFCTVRPMHGFSAQMSSTLIIAISSLMGGHVSTTHVTSMSIVGAGAAESVGGVQWHFVQRVLLTWVVTIPATAILACLIRLALAHFGIP